MASLVAIGFFMLVLAAVPKLVRAQGRGRALTYQLGAGPLLEPQVDSDGLHRINLGNDHFVAGVVSARLEELGIRHAIYSSGGGEVGAHAAQVLLYDEAGDAVVRGIVADLADDS